VLGVGLLVSGFWVVWFDLEWLVVYCGLVLLVGLLVVEVVLCVW
jgi:hypothetical protein